MKQAATSAEVHPAAGMAALKPSVCICSLLCCYRAAAQPLGKEPDLRRGHPAAGAAGAAAADAARRDAAAGRWRRQRRRLPAAVAASAAAGRTHRLGRRWGRLPKPSRRILWQCRRNPASLAGKLLSGGIRLTCSTRAHPSHEACHDCVPMHVIEHPASSSPYRGPAGGRAHGAADGRAAAAGHAHRPGGPERLCGRSSSAAAGRTGESADNTWGSDSLLKRCPYQPAETRGQSMQSLNGG